MRRAHLPFLPAIGAEEQMNRPVIKLRLVREVGRDHLPDTGGPVREPPSFGIVAFAFEEGQQPGTLRRFPAPVQAFQDHQSATAALAAQRLHSHALKRPPALREQAEGRGCCRRRRRFADPAAEIGSKHRHPQRFDYYAHVFGLGKASGGTGMTHLLHEAALPASQTNAVMHGWVFRFDQTQKLRAEMRRRQRLTGGAAQVEKKGEEVELRRPRETLPPELDGKRRLWSSVIREPLDAALGSG